MNLHAAPPIPIDKNYVFSVILFAFWIIVKTTIFATIDFEDQKKGIRINETALLSENFLRIWAIIGIIYQLSALTFLNSRTVWLTLVVDGITVVIELHHVYLAMSTYHRDLIHAYSWDISVISFILTMLQSLINAYYLLVKARIKEVMTSDEGTREHFKALKQNAKNTDTQKKRQ